MFRTPGLLCLLSLSACHPGGTRANATSNIGGTVADTIDVLEAVWRAAIPKNRAERTIQFYLPSVDSAVLTVSDTVRAALDKRHIPAVSRMSIGDDTTIVAVRRWRVDSANALAIELQTSVSTILGSGTKPCRARSGSLETYAARRVAESWVARRVGPVEAGDDVCVPITPRPSERRSNER
jgi:hypothetical protein